MGYIYGDNVYFPVQKIFKENRKIGVKPINKHKRAQS